MKKWAGTQKYIDELLPNRSLSRQYIEGSFIEGLLRQTCGGIVHTDCGSFIIAWKLTREMMGRFLVEDWKYFFEKVNFEPPPRQYIEGSFSQVSDWSRIWRHRIWTMGFSYCQTDDRGKRWSEVVNCKGKKMNPKTIRSIRARTIAEIDSLISMLFQRAFVLPEG